MKHKPLTTPPTEAHIDALERIINRLARRLQQKAPPPLPVKEWVEVSRARLGYPPNSEIMRRARAVMKAGEILTAMRLADKSSKFYPQKRSAFEALVANTETERARRRERRAAAKERAKQAKMFGVTLK